MLQSTVGPPVKGVADFVAPDSAKAGHLKETKKAGSDSFGDIMGTKGKESPATTAQDKVQRVESKRRDPEKTAEKLKSTNDDKGDKKTKSGGQRQQAILKFMDSFESEFGVPPTRIVEAMANLDQTQQTESPEETADQVIGQLDLDDQKTDQAKNMYLGLLAQLSQLDKQQQSLPKPEKLGEGAAASAGLMTGAMAHERFVAGQEKMQALNKSLDSMNEKFWMKGPQPDLADKLAQMNMQEKLGQSANAANLNIDEASFAQELPKDPALAPNFKDVPPGLKNPSELSATSTESDEVTSTAEGALAALVAAARAVKGSKGENADQDAVDADASNVNDSNLTNKAEVTPGAAKNVDVLAQAKGEEKGFGSQLGQQQRGQEGFANQSSGLKNAKGEMIAKTKLSDKAEFSKLVGDGSLQPQALKPEADFSPNAVAASAPGMASITPQENEANVRQLMNQAQYLIKKGGGEMKVQMSPEGMGNIHMKVLVENGKVNVQMAADTSEAKKTLESGLSDLKNSLAAHKLSMDHVKIDVVNSTNADNNLQNQTNQDQAGREQTRQFWNKFSENFGSPSQQRENFADIPNLRGYARKRTDAPLEPINSASVSKYAGTGKGGGLNLVA